MLNHIFLIKTNIKFLQFIFKRKSFTLILTNSHPTKISAQVLILFLIQLSKKNSLKLHIRYLLVIESIIARLLNI